MYIEGNLISRVTASFEMTLFGHASLNSAIESCTNSAKNVLCASEASKVSNAKNVFAAFLFHQHPRPFMSTDIIQLDRPNEIVCPSPSALFFQNLLKLKPDVVTIGEKVPDCRIPLTDTILTKVVDICSPGSVGYYSLVKFLY